MDSGFSNYIAFQKIQLIAIKLLLHFIFAINCNQIGPKPGVESKYNGENEEIGD